MARTRMNELTHQLGMTSPVADVLSNVYRPGSKLRVLDLCTGSGVQGINAALHARAAVSDAHNVSVCVRST